MLIQTVQIVHFLINCCQGSNHLSAMKNQDELGIRRFIEVSRAGGQLRGSSPSLLHTSPDLDGLAGRFKRRGYAPVVLLRKFALNRLEGLILNDYSGSMKKPPQRSEDHPTWATSIEPKNCNIASLTRPRVLDGFIRFPLPTSVCCDDTAP